MRKPILAAILAAGVILSVTACGSSSPASATAPARAAAARSASPRPSHSRACTRKTTFDYIERDDDPGASVTAGEIGNTDYVNCTSSLADFAATAGQAAGECTTIALASGNPGYDVSEVPAPRLKHLTSPRPEGRGFPALAG
jgi:hypothetical protein